MNALSALLFMSYVTGILTLRKRGGSIDSQDFPSGALIFYTHNSPGVAGLKAH